MKKLSALLLALVLAATLCFGAMAESINYVGIWALTLITDGESSLDPSALGVEMYIMLNEDGTCIISTAGETEEGTWEPTETGVKLIDAEEILEIPYVDGALMMEAEGLTMVFTPSEGGYASVCSGLTLADFNGNWVLEHVETTFGMFSVSDMGAAMTVQLADGAAHIEMIMEDEVIAYEAICETEEADDLGTILWASFLDPTTGEPDGTGMMFLLYDDGQLVWYEYDSMEQCEYYYCFDLVVETAE